MLFSDSGGIKQNKMCKIGVKLMLLNTLESDKFDRGFDVHKANSFRGRKKYNQYIQRQFMKLYKIEKLRQKM